MKKTAIGLAIVLLGMIAIGYMNIPSVSAFTDGTFKMNPLDEDGDTLQGLEATVTSVENSSNSQTFNAGLDGKITIDTTQLNWDKDLESEVDIQILDDEDAFVFPLLTLELGSSIYSQVFCTNGMCVQKPYQVDNIKTCSGIVDDELLSTDFSNIPSKITYGGTTGKIYFKASVAAHMEAKYYPIGFKYRLTITDYFFTAYKGSGQTWNEITSVRNSIDNDVTLYVDNRNGYGNDDHWDPTWVIEFDRINMPSTLDYKIAIGADWDIDRWNNGQWETTLQMNGYSDEDDSGVIDINV